MGKSFSTLCATALQHLSACRGSHSLTETVYFALLSFLGLESSFHNSLLLNLVFYLFRFFIFYRRLPTITPSLYRKTVKPSSDFARLFVCFLYFYAYFLGLRSGFQRKNEILAPFRACILHYEGGNFSVKRNGNRFFVQSL